MEAHDILDDQLYNLIFLTNEDKNNLKKIEKLILNGADVNNAIFDKHTGCMEVILSIVIDNLHNSSSGKITDYYANVAELLLKHGARVDSVDDDPDCDCLSALDNLILLGGKYGLNQNTYRLAKIMITSLNDKDMKHYLIHHRNLKTFTGLQNILKEFCRYDKYIEYMF